ncbi:MAG TPA: hypothetical protein VII78_12025 [Myxococcota bacterium]
MRRSAAADCALERRDCPLRDACRRDAESLARARAGSRADFDAVYGRIFALVYRAASTRLANRALAEVATRELLESAFRAPAPALARGCGSSQLVVLMKQLGARVGRTPA